MEGVVYMVLGWFRYGVYIKLIGIIAAAIGMADMVLCNTDFSFI